MLPTLIIVVIGYLVYRVYLFFEPKIFSRRVRDARDAAPNDPASPAVGQRYADYPLKQGDVFRLDTPGGGGYGDPLARDPQHVLADVREGYVSPEAAEREYGVALTGDGDGARRVDEASTARQRAAMRSAKG